MAKFTKSEKKLEREFMEATKGLSDKQRLSMINAEIKRRKMKKMS